MKIALYREIISLFRRARALKPHGAWNIPLYAATEFAAFAYDEQIVSASEYLNIMEHCQKERENRHPKDRKICRKR